MLLLLATPPPDPSNDKQRTDCPRSLPFPGSSYLEETGIAAAVDKQEFLRYRCWVFLLSRVRPPGTFSLESKGLSYQFFGFLVVNRMVGF